MPTQKWVCDTCDEPFDTWDEAKECEDLHAGVYDQAIAEEGGE